VRPYSIDLRQRVLKDSDAGMGTRVVATKYHVSESWVRRLKQRRRQTNQIGPCRRGPQPTKWGPHAECLTALVAAQPDATLRELRDQLKVPLSVPTLCRALQTLKFSFKKKF
jgi:transposase